MVRKGIKNGLTSEIDADVDRFFALYADNVHRHGTPPFSKRYFARLQRSVRRRLRGADRHRRRRQRRVSGVLSFYFRDEVLPYYAGDTADARDLAANDFKYWELMRRACERGLRVFDYGRSKRGTGSFDFKKNWGFEPTPLALRVPAAQARRDPAEQSAQPEVSGVHRAVAAPAACRSSTRSVRCWSAIWASHGRRRTMGARSGRTPRDARRQSAEVAARARGAGESCRRVTTLARRATPDGAQLAPRAGRSRPILPRSASWPSTGDRGVDRCDLVALGDVRARLRRRADLPVAGLARAARSLAAMPATPWWPGLALVLRGRRAVARRLGRPSLRRQAVRARVHAAGGDRHGARCERRARGSFPARVSALRRAVRRILRPDADRLDRRFHRRARCACRACRSTAKATSSSFPRAPGRSSRHAAASATSSRR